MYTFVYTLRVYIFSSYTRDLNFIPSRGKLLPLIGRFPILMNEVYRHLSFDAAVTERASAAEPQKCRKAPSRAGVTVRRCDLPLETIRSHQSCKTVNRGYNSIMSERPRPQSCRVLCPCVSLALGRPSTRVCAVDPTNSASYRSRYIPCVVAERINKRRRSNSEVTVCYDLDLILQSSSRLSFRPTEFRLVIAFNCKQV